MDELMQPNAFILLGGSESEGEGESESEPARATGEERPPPLNSAGVQTEEVDGEKADGEAELP